MQRRSTLRAPFRGAPSSLRTRTRRTTGALAALGLLAFGVFHGCRPAGSVPPVEPVKPPWLSEPVAAEAPPLAGEVIEPVPAHVADTTGAIFDPSEIVAILDDPRLTVVRAHLAREANKGAADELEGLLRAAPPSEPAGEAAWWYQLGRLRLSAGDPGAAVRAFDQAAAIDWPLSDYARFHAADLLIALDQPGEAEARLGQIRGKSAIDDEVVLARARALAKARRVDEAVAIWRGYVERQGDGWEQVALTAVRALLNQPSVDRAEWAVELAQRVIKGSTHKGHVYEARELEDTALGTLPNERRTRFTEPLEQQVALARGLAFASQGREALKAADDALAALQKAGREAQPSPLSCDAHLARGKALEVLRRYQDASDALGTAAERCAGHHDLVVALFLGGRAALRGGLSAEARRRYAELERKFPDHRYADDARLHGAEAAENLGDAAAFTRMLSTIADDYPNGDMVDQALFTLARSHLERGDWAAAVGPLERAVAKQKRGRPYWAEGRPQYFLARARLELGATDEGLRRLEEVIRDFPLGYYMVQAHARLAARDPKRAERALSEAVAREPQGDFVIPDHAELHRPGFLRVRELVRQGDGERAVRELDLLGVRDTDAHPSLLWASAFLLARIDAPTQSHGLLRREGQAWQEHYPAGVWRTLWEVAYPRPFLPLVQKETLRSGIPEHLAFAIIREESAFIPGAVSHAGAYGLMQLIVPTAESVAKTLGLPATKAALKRPEVNIALGCEFLARLGRKFPENPLLSIPGYNAGPGAPARWVKERPAEDFDIWVERIPYKETRHYTKRVIQSMAAYAFLYGEGMRAPLLSPPLSVQP
jgi:soluble lytic murein transglycosylase